MPHEPEVLIRSEVRSWAAAAAVGVPLGLGLVGWFVPDVFAAVAAICVVVLAPIALGVGPWRIAMDAEGITIGGLLRRRWRWSEVDRITAALSLGERYVMIVPRSRWRTQRRLRFASWGTSLLRALPGHAPPGTYRITAADEQMLAGKTKHERVRRDRAARTAARAASYRESVRERATVSLEQPLPAERGCRRRAWLRTALGVALVATASAVEGPARALAVLGSIVTLFLVVRAWGVVRSHAQVRARVREWVGDRAQVDPRGMLVSESGHRRFRQLPADLDDPWMGLHFHLEDLEAGGIARSSTPRVGPDLGLPAAMRASASRELARVIEGRGQRVVPAFVVVDAGPDGALLHRFDDRGRAIGDTFHEHASAARAQVAREATIDRWRELDPRDDPWSLARIAAQHEEGEASDASTPAAVTRSTGTPP